MKKEIWSIGICQGPSPFLLSDDEIDNPVLTADDVTDVDADFVADPFIIKSNETWYMFFEVLESNSGIGSIGLASSKDSYNWIYDKIVLKEPFHLSYPYIFKFENDYYLCPESCASGATYLYRAVEFPYYWKRIETLVIGDQFVDPTLFFKDNLWWLMLGVRSCDKLYLYHADKLQGPYLPHPLNPVVSGNKQTTRPAGRPFLWKNRLFRFGQDSTKTYGGHFGAIIIVRLSQTEYIEKKVNIDMTSNLSLDNWARDGKHHIDLQMDDNNWFAVFDGKQFL